MVNSGRQNGKPTHNSARRAIIAAIKILATNDNKRERKDLSGEIGQTQPLPKP